MPGTLCWPYSLTFACPMPSAWKAFPLFTWLHQIHHMLNSQLESSVVTEVGCGEPVPGQSWGGSFSFWGGHTAGRLMRGDFCQKDLQVDKRLWQPWITTGVAVGGSPRGQVYLPTILSPLPLQPGRKTQHNTGSQLTGHGREKLGWGGQRKELGIQGPMGVGLLCD